MFVYKVEVHCASHAAVGAGRFDQRVSYHRVAAASDVEAVELACCVAMSTAPEAMMATSALLLDFPEVAA